MNLIPDKPLETGNYFCTWDTQHNVTFERLPLGNRISPRDAMNEDFLFGEEGILNSFDGVRGDLIAVLDDGWDVPYGATDSRLFGSMEADTDRFPSLKGLTPAERIRALSDRVKALGYKGLGLWVPSQAPVIDGGVELDRSMGEERAYWEERARWCNEAGVLYWKVDWGKHQGNPEFCAMVTECARRYAPGLKVEHCFISQPLFGAGKPDEEKRRRDDAYLKAVLPVSDYLRTYDVPHELKYSATLNRTSICLLGAQSITGECGVLNIEDTEIIGAALGCSIGVMRHELEKSFVKLPQPYRPVSDTFRALRWQRIAPPFPANSGEVNVSDEWLKDVYVYRNWPENLWPNPEDGKEYYDSAPAVIARNMPLPEVYCTGEKPFVAASINPESHALCVAVIPRTDPVRGEYTPPAKITVKGKRSSAPIGLFGRFEKLTIEFEEPLNGRKVIAQSLLADEAKDVTDVVFLSGSCLSVSGEAALSVADDAAENEIPALVLSIV